MELTVEEMIVKAINNPDKKFTNKAWLEEGDEGYIYWSTKEHHFLEEYDCNYDIDEFTPSTGWLEYKGE